MRLPRIKGNTKEDKDVVEMLNDFLLSDFTLGDVAERSTPDLPKSVHLHK